MSRQLLQTEIEITTSPERVWAIGADFTAYPRWNPFIRSILGVPEKSMRFKVRRSLDSHA